MKYIERELTDGEKTGWQLIKEMWNETFGPKPPPKCTVADLVEHYDAYNKHIDQIYLMIRWIKCHGDKHVMTYDPLYRNGEGGFESLRYFSENIRQIQYQSQAINRYVDAFLDVCKKAGQT